MRIASALMWGVLFVVLTLGHLHLYGRTSFFELLLITVTIGCGFMMIARVAEAMEGPTPMSDITAADFGPARHGVHLYAHEDDWGWTAYGHHEPRRVIAAISSEARETGVAEELREYLYGAPLADYIIETWAHQFHYTADGFEFKLCAAGTPWAVPVTVVSP